MKYAQLTLSLLLLGFAAQAAAPKALSVAVFDFESKDEAIRDLGPKAAVLVNAALSAEPALVLVERAELEKVLGEQELSLSGTVSPDTAARVGHLTGAKVLVTGRVFKADGETVLVAKIIGTETSRVFGEMVQGASGRTLTELAGELARKIAATLQSRGDTLVATVRSAEERLAALKKSFKTDKRPSVSVSVPERHFGQPVADPAVETELKLLLQQCGFTVIDEKSAAKAQVEITGEAFSAYGTRRGNLVSCKARIELKALDRSGKVLAVDRQTGVAIDLAEQTAAKTALQTAAADLAERFLPKLTQ